MLVALVLVALSDGLVVAHGGGGPGLEVVPNRVVPAETVSVLGEELEPLASVQVDLLTAAGDQRVIDTDADEDGHFVESLVVPAELAARVYELRATDGAGVVVSTYLTVLPYEQAGNETTFPPVGAMSVALPGVVVAGLLLLTVRRLVRRGRDT